MKLTTCLVCGYKELWIEISPKIENLLSKAQIKYVENYGDGYCYKCKGYITIKSPKWKMVQKIIKRFPGKKVIKTFMNMDDVANGEGDMRDNLVIDAYTSEHKELVGEFRKYRDLVTKRG